MKFLISEAEYEVLPHESLQPVDFDGIVFEKVFESKRKLRGLGEYITEDTRKQVHIIMSPVLQGEEEYGQFTMSGVSVIGAKLLYELREGITVSLVNLQAIAGVGEFNLWIKGRRFGEHEIVAGQLVFDDEFIEELFQIIDLEIGLNREEWFTSKYSNTD